MHSMPCTANYADDMTPSLQHSHMMAIHVIGKLTARR